MSAPELRPCPAGTEARMKSWAHFNSVRPSASWGYQACVRATSGWTGPEVHMRTREEAEREAARLWNTRAPSSDWPSLRRLEREEVSDDS